MPDLKKTQAQWTAMFREFTQYLRLHKISEGVRGRFLGSNIKVLELNEGANVVSAWTFVGAIRGVNCGEGGRLFINLNDETPGAAQAQIQVYSDSAKTALVAQGDSGDGTTVTLAEQNNSGLSGTALLGTVGASDTDIVLLLDIDEERKALDTFGPSDGSTSARRGHIDRLRVFEATLRGLSGGNRADMERNFLRTALAEFMVSATISAISIEEVTDDNGDVQVTYTGLLAELDDAMQDETTAVAQTIERNVVAVAAAIFDADNAGTGAVVNISQREHAIEGTITFRCVVGKADSLEEDFDVTLLDINGNAITSSLRLRVKKIWESGIMGIRLRLDRTITDANDGSNQVSGYVINGETLANTDVGKLYLELTDAAGTRTVKLFANAAKTNLVAQGSRVGDGVITLAEQSSSGLTGTVVVAFTVTDLDIVVDLNAFAEGDIFTVVVTNDEAGRIQTLIKQLWGFSLNSAVAASETIPDLMVEESADHIIAVS